VLEFHFLILAWVLSKGIGFESSESQYRGN
jgi:hypothetical protein